MAGLALGLSGLLGGLIPQIFGGAITKREEPKVIKNLVRYLYDKGVVNTSISKREVERELKKAIKRLKSKNTTKRRRKRTSSKTRSRWLA